MSVITLRGTTAMIALSVALGAGSPVLAQATPPAPAPEFIPVPAPAIAAPEADWLPYTRMGFRFEIPASLPVDQDEDGIFAASTLDGDRTTGISIAIQRFDARSFAALPAADTPALASFLRQVTRLDMQPTGGAIRLGAFALAEYRGAAMGEDGIEREAVIYISQELTDGEALMVVVVSAGIGGAAAGELEARFIGSMMPENSVPADQPDTETDEDGAADQTADDAPQLALAEPSSDGVVVAEPPTEVTIVEVEPAASAEAPEAAAEIAEAPPVDEAEQQHERAVAAVEAMPDPSGSVPEGWNDVERFGIRVAAPAGLEIVTDRTSPVRDFALRGRAEGVEGEIGLAVSVLPADRLPAAPTDPAFAEALLGQPEGRASLTARTVILGDRLMVSYAVTRAADPDDAVPSLFALYLVDAEPDAEGNLRLIGLRTEGATEDQSLELAALFLSSIGTTEELPAAEPSAADSGTTEAPVAAPEMPAAEGPGVAVPPEAVLLPDLVSLDLPEGISVINRLERRNTTALSLADTDGGLPQTRIAAGLLTRSLEEVLPRMLVHLDALIETEVGGQPVLVAYGPTTHDVNDATVAATNGVPARVIIPQACVDGQPPYVVLMVTRPEAEFRLDEVQAYLSLSAPAEADACPADLADRVQAIIPAPQPVAVAIPERVVLSPNPAAVPADWVAQEGLGLRFSVPGDLVIAARDESPTQLTLTLEAPGAPAATYTEITFKLLDAAELAGMSAQTPDQPGLATMLSGFAAMPVAPTGAIFALDDARFHLLQGEALHTIDGQERNDRVLYLIPEAPFANGLTLWIAIQSIGQEPLDAAALERAFIASLTGTPQVGTASVRVDPASIPMPPPPTQPSGKPDAPFVADAPQPSVPPATGPSTAMTEARAWEAARQANTAEAMLAYLAQFPRGLNSGEARGWLHARDIYAPDEHRPEPISPQVAEDVPAQMTDMQAWQLAMMEGRPEALWTYLKMFPQGSYADQARQVLASLAGRIAATPTVTPPYLPPSTPAK